MRRLILAAKLKTGANTPAVRRARGRGPLRGLRGRIPMRTGVALLLTGTLAGVGLWSWHSGAAARQIAHAGTALQNSTAEAGLAVQQVYVRGRELTRRSALRAALGVQRGTPILALNPAAAKARIERLPWVERAAVIRELPGKVRVVLRERRPMARWQHRGSVQVLDRTGTPVRGVDAGRFADLPLVVGPGAPPATKDLLATLRRRPDMAGRVEAAVRVSQRRWNLKMHNGVEVQLPSSGAADAWRRVADLEARYGLLQRDIRVVDLRLPDQLVVRLAPDAEPYGPAVASGEAT